MIMMLTGRLAQLGEGPIHQHSMVQESMSVIEAVMVRNSSRRFATARDAEPLCRRQQIQNDTKPCQGWRVRGHCSVG